MFEWSSPRVTSGVQDGKGRIDEVINVSEQPLHFALIVLIPVDIMHFMERADRRAHHVRKSTLAESDIPGDLSALTPGERVVLVWQLTKEAWTFKDGRWDEPRLRRDVGRVVRRRS